MDLSAIGGCFAGVQPKNNGGVYWYQTADDRGVRGNPLDSQQMQTGQAKEGSGTMPMVVGTAHGPGHQKQIWVRWVMVQLGFRLRFCMGKSNPGGYKATAICVCLSLV